MRKPKEPIPRLFDYRRNLLNYVIDKIKAFPIKTSLTKEDYRYKECRLEYLVVELKTAAKKKAFVEAVYSLRTEEVDVLSLDAFLKEKRQLVDKQGKSD